MGLRRSFKPTNGVTNGDFKAGTTGWTRSGASLSVNNKVLSVIGDGSSQFVYISQNTSLNIVTNHKYYLVSKQKVINSECSQINLFFNDTNSSGQIDALTIYNPTINQDYLMSGVAQTTNNTGYVVVKLHHFYSSATAANGKVMEVQEVMAIDLTACLPADILALSKNNLKAWCDLNIPYWFDGTLGGGVIGSIGGLK